MKTLVLVAVLVAAVAAVGIGAFVLMGGGGGDDVESGLDEPYTGEVNEPKEVKTTSPSQWSYVGGDSGSFGVTDAKTPISKTDLVEKWKVTSVIDPSATAWKTPSSAICVDDRVYYYKGQESSLYCVDVETGNLIGKASCPSRTVYNMAIAYGDGKIFAVTSVLKSNRAYSVLYAFDAETMGQLFISSPASGGETQGTVTYHDGKVFFGTYSGDYACFSTEDLDPTRSDEVIEPLWLLECDGWYNATPAFFDDYIVIVKRGFDESEKGATAFFMDADTGRVIDTVHFDREYASSGATAYEGRVYIPLNRVADRNEKNPNENTPEKLAIRSYKVTPDGFDESSMKFWESEESFWKQNYKGDVWGGTQSIPVIWNDTIYIGGGGKTLGSNEPLWVIDIDKNGDMKTRHSFKDVCTKSTVSLTTAYSTAENGNAVYLYVMEYGHVYQGEAADSVNGYADIFVIKDVKGGTPTIVFSMRPNPAQFNYQSFTVTKDGHVLIRNDTTLFCYGVGTEYTAEDVSSAIDRFIAMSESGNVNYMDYQRILARYAELSDDEKAKVSNYSQLEGMCVSLTLKAAGGDVVLTVPKGTIVEIPDVPVPVGKVLTGWKNGSSAWCSFNTPVKEDTVLKPVYKDAVTVTLDPQNGEGASKITVGNGEAMPFIVDPSKDGYEFGGWYSGSTQYIPNKTAVSKNVTLTAKWLKVSMLKFDTDGGSTITSIYYAVYDKPLGNLPTSVKAGYAFKGWFYDGKEYTSDTVYKFNESITLKARWAENSESTVDNGKGVYVTGKIPADATLTVGSLSTNGSTYKRINEACNGADCLIISLKGDGINSNLPLKVKVKADSSFNGKSVKVYYCLDEVIEVTGTVKDGYLEFTAKGGSVYGGVQLAFGVQKDLMIKGSW